MHRDPTGGYQNVQSYARNDLVSHPDKRNGLGRGSLCREFFGIADILESSGGGSGHNTDSEVYGSGSIDGPGTRDALAS